MRRSSVSDRQQHTGFQNLTRQRCLIRQHTSCLCKLLQTHLFCGDQVGAWMSEILETSVATSLRCHRDGVGAGLLSCVVWGTISATGHIPHFKLKFSLALSIGTWC